MTTGTISIKASPVIYDNTNTKYEYFSTNYMKALITDVTIGNTLYTLIKDKFVKVKIKAIIAPMGVKVDFVDDNDIVNDGTIFHPSQFFIKCD